MSSVLVVDDDPDVLYSLEKSLRSDSLDVIAAKTGKECLDLVQRRPPGAVVLDVRLPDMSGLDVFDRIRAIDPRLPVVVITAFARTDTAIEAMKRGGLSTSSSRSICTNCVKWWAHSRWPMLAETCSIHSLESP